MPRWMWCLVLALLMGIFVPFAANADSNFSGPSILQPNETFKDVIRYPVDAIDPTPETNPKGANDPGYRGAQQLVVYTPAFGSYTQTNTFGAEAIVVDGKIQAITGNDSPIPSDGFVISGNAQSGQWIQRVLKVGESVTLNQETHQIVVRITPSVYLDEVKQAIQRAQDGSTNQADPQYQENLMLARQCFDQLSTLALAGVDQAFVDKAQTCQQDANEAYYLTVPSYSREFRGIWVRPVEQSPEEVRQTVAALKEDNIENIFLETYYEGRTLYPSKVMADYGLPSQHAEFQGWDPLKAWIAAAKEYHIKLHVWVQTFFAGDKNISIEADGPILQKYPSWSNVQYQSMSRTQPVASAIEDGHFFLDPANPQVRTFLTKLILEIETNYDIDGLNLDYIRYPASYPEGRTHFLASNWGYTPYARNTFKTIITDEVKAALAQKRAEEEKRLAAKRKAEAARRERLVKARHQHGKSHKVLAHRVHHPPKTAHTVHAKPHLKLAKKAPPKLHAKEALKGPPKVSQAFPLSHPSPKLSDATQVDVNEKQMLSTPNRAEVNLPLPLPPTSAETGNPTATQTPLTEKPSPPAGPSQITNAKPQPSETLQSVVQTGQPMTQKAMLAAGDKLLAEAKITLNTKPPYINADPKAILPNSLLWSRWVAWRENQVSSFVEEISEKVHAAKPDVMISAVVFPHFSPTYSIKLQDWPLWVQKGWVQMLTPIGLGPTPKGIYRDCLEFKRLTQDKVPVYVGIFGMYERSSPIVLLSEINAAHRAGMPGVVLFEKSRLTPAYREALLKGPFRN